jgi:adenosylmethionine-8-amino-7-oxononanoate aminotransferase
MADTSFWHPFADMASVRGNELVLVRGEGMYLWDDAGNRYLDGSASLWYCNVGHGRTEIADAVAAQMRTLETWSTFGDVANQPALELAELLSAHAPMDGGKVFFTTGGGDAIDTAAKFARLYWQTIGQPERLHMIGRANGYHGTMAFGASIGGMEAVRTGWGPLVQGTSQVQHDSPQALRDEIERVGAERVAAFFCEPVMGAAGVYPPAPGYIEEIADICKETGVLLVIDAVIVGFGRIGGWFGCERFGIRPDMITFAKGVTSGYLPLGGVVMSDRIAEPFWSEPGRIMVRHGQTYAGHATVCAAALTNLAIIEREGLMSRGQELEGELQSALAPLADHPLVGEVRSGTGLMAGVELAADVLDADHDAALKLYRGVRSRGVLVRAHARGLAISPPLIVTTEQIREIADVVHAALEELAPVALRVR